MKTYEFQNRSFVHLFFDRHIRLWTIIRYDAAGDQYGDAEHEHDRETAFARAEYLSEQPSGESMQCSFEIGRTFDGGFAIIAACEWDGFEYAAETIIDCDDQSRKHGIDFVLCMCQMALRELQETMRRAIAAQPLVIKL